MTRKELLSAVALKAGVEPKEAEKVFEAVFEVLSDEIANGGVRVNGFGSFKVVERKARVAKNPRTGAEVKVPAKKVVGFKVADCLKERL